jgi:hypothetical protein
MTMNHMQHECAGGRGEVAMSQAEIRDCLYRCSTCGKVLRIRPRLDGTATLPRHNSKQAIMQSKLPSNIPLNR